MKKALFLLMFLFFTLGATDLFASFDTSSLEGTVFKIHMDRFIVAESAKDRITQLGRIMQMKNLPDWNARVRPVLLNYIPYLLETRANPEYISKITRDFINFQILAPSIRRDLILHINNIDLSGLSEKDQKAALDLYVFLTERIRWNNEKKLWVHVGFIKDLKVVANKLRESFVKFVACIQTYIQTLKERGENPGDLNVDNPEERDAANNNNLPADDSNNDGNEDENNNDDNATPSNDDAAPNT